MGSVSHSSGENGNSLFISEVCLGAVSVSASSASRSICSKLFSSKSVIRKMLLGAHFPAPLNVEHLKEQSQT
eukprot:14851199-Ditylum_brightwellii.AAC.1